MRRGWLQLWNRAGTISYSCVVWKNCVKSTPILSRLVFSEESEGKEVEGEPAAN